MSVVLVRCRARKERANERARDENRRRRLAAAQRRRKRSQRNFFPTQKQIKIGDLSSSSSDSRENKRKPPVTTTTHFSCSIFASCNLTTAFVQCDPQSMPYFSCSNALFFVLDASTAVVPKDDERRTTRDTVARHIVLLLERGIAREELCFFFVTTKISSSSLLLQSVQKVGRVSLSVQKRSSLLWGFVHA